MSQVRKKFDFKKLTTDYYSFNDLQKAVDRACHDKANIVKIMINFD